jgi:anhydro-N-acetylmuramic acid kinase|tara:strand:+ start:373 stop:1524 length:1152 start_codon:yes stop_codon:yes gene_type:complete
MGKIYTALGLMSGTSLDGVDFSIIQTDGKEYLSLSDNNYIEFSNTLRQKIREIKSKITSTNKCKEIIKSDEYKDLSDEITMFHQEGMIRTVGYGGDRPIDIIGFHGITLWHKPPDKYTHQIGDAKLLKKSIAKYKNLKNSEIIFNFRKNDILNEGQGAPLTPIYHKALMKHLKIVDPRLIVNIGGITNVTYLNRGNIFSTDIGPGNCLIDKWMTKNFDKDFDKDGKIALEGKINQNIANNFLDKLKKTKKNKNVSYDTSDFDISEFNKLNPKDGVATLSFITAKAILNFAKDLDLKRIIICGGGRLNQAILNNLKKDRFIISLMEDVKSSQSDDLIWNLNGDFIESQAFAYIAVRSFLKLPISFPETTGCNKPCTGGVIIENF